MPAVICDLMGVEKKQVLSYGNLEPDPKSTGNPPLPSFTLTGGGYNAGEGAPTWQQIMYPAIQQGLSAGPFAAGNTTGNFVREPGSPPVSNDCAGDGTSVSLVPSGGFHGADDGADHVVPCLMAGIRHRMIPVPIRRIPGIGGKTDGRC